MSKNWDKNKTDERLDVTKVKNTKQRLVVGKWALVRGAIVHRGEGKLCVTKAHVEANSKV
jgi:hypothetical protein